MLVIKRRVGQIVRIGEADVMVVEVRNGAAKLGISAPRDVPVTREELIPTAQPLPDEAVGEWSDDDVEMGGEA